MFLYMCGSDKVRLTLSAIHDQDARPRISSECDAHMQTGYM